jgi:hypothetical protein
MWLKLDSKNTQKKDFKNTYLIIINDATVTAALAMTHY